MPAPRHSARAPASAPVRPDGANDSAAPGDLGSEGLSAAHGARFSASPTNPSRYRPSGQLDLEFLAERSRRSLQGGQGYGRVGRIQEPL
jgi:hypothetical protein